MFRKLSIVGLAGVLVLVGGGLTMALAGNSITTPETLVFTETSLKQKFIDVGKTGFGPGDSFLFVDSLTDPADGSRVGTVRGDCTFFIGGKWESCQVSAFINDRGEIVVSGVAPSTNHPMPLDFAITGGTGEFDNVRGSVHIDPVSTTEEKTTVTLLP